MAIKLKSIFLIQYKYNLFFDVCHSFYSTLKMVHYLTSFISSFKCVRLLFMNLDIFRYFNST